tara:strand:- start:1606 stop:1830 length:225 start_codon:yes stop_codon:yes gene_type:complete
MKDHTTLTTLEKVRRTAPNLAYALALNDTLKYLKNMMDGTDGERKLTDKEYERLVDYTVKSILSGPDAFKNYEA